MGMSAKRIYVPKKKKNEISVAPKKKKKETFAEKAKRKLQEYMMPKEKEDKAFEGSLGATVSKMNRRRKLMEESLKY